jgi:hypothetical protein
VNRLKNRIAALAVLLFLAFGASAFGALDEGPGKGNPTTTQNGNCPPGQNKDTSTGGLKKC